MEVVWRCSLSTAGDAIFLTQEKVFLQVKCPICAAGTGLVPVHPNADFIPQTQARPWPSYSGCENLSKKTQLSNLLSDVPICSRNHFTPGINFLCIYKSRLVFPVQWLACMCEFLNYSDMALLLFFFFLACERM